MTEQAHEPKVKPNPYDFITRLDGEEPGRFRCEHKEANGVFVCKKMTVRDLSSVEMLKATLMGGSLMEQGERLAEWQAWAGIGFAQTPDGFAVANIHSERLLHALYIETQTHHNFFREAPLEGAF